MPRLCRLASVALVVALGAARPTAATVLLVTDLGHTGAPGQLRTTIAAASGGDTIVIPPVTIDAGSNAACPVTDMRAVER